MNEITENLVKEFRAKVAIVVYSPDDSFDDCYLESHVIDNAGRVMAGKPLKQETLNGIVDVFYGQQQERSAINGFIPNGLLYFEQMSGGHYKMVWYTPAHLQYLHFAEHVKLKSGQAWVPPMVWKAEKELLTVYALRQDERPNPETELCQAPFYNVSAGGVCMGSAKVQKPKENSYLSVIDYWEKMFWNSVFTESGGSSVKSSLTAVWRKLLKDKTIGWDKLDELKAMSGNMKLKKLLA